MRIALDAMGTDLRPVPDIEGAILASKEISDTIILVGDKAMVQRELDKHGSQTQQFEIVHSPQIIGMDERPSDVLKSKPDSSIHIGMNLVKDKKADAFVTMGNTGAVMTVATLGTLRRIPGIKRPAISAIFPVMDQQRIFLDVGANTDSKPEWLQQYAIMGKVYAERVLNINNPRVAVLSNGEEHGKGDHLVQLAHDLIAKLDINFVGNVEPKDILTGTIDVLVMDGFVGNIFLKTVEGSIRFMGEVLREELLRDIRAKMGAWLARPALRRVRDRIDSTEIGGAPLLGVNGVVIIGHGGSNAYAIKNAIMQARLAVLGNTIQAISDGLAQLMSDQNDTDA